MMLAHKNPMMSKKTLAAGKWGARWQILVWWLRSFFFFFKIIQNCQHIFNLSQVFLSEAVALTDTVILRQNRKLYNQNFEVYYTCLYLVLLQLFPEK